MQAVLEKPKAESASKESATRARNLATKGEDVAAMFLERQGYSILERNWTCEAGSADIIARDEEWLVFVEVKTRRNDEKGFPSDTVSEKKREKYEKIALAYASSFPQTDVPVRFDVISIVVIGSGKAMIRHHLNAFTR